jgi:hypothetical protein
MITRPDRSEFADYYQTYVSKVPDGDIRRTLRDQAGTAAAMLEAISPSKASYRYAPDKWSTRQVLSHISDTERVFAFRAYWFARGFPTELPSFDQDDAVKTALADERDWDGLVQEFRAVRAASLALFDSLDPAAWARSGIARGNPFTVRALAWITAGHVEHHLRILHERYL